MNELLYTKIEILDNLLKTVYNLNISIKDNTLKIQTIKYPIRTLLNITTDMVNNKRFNKDILIKKLIVEIININKTTS